MFKHKPYSRKKKKKKRKERQRLLRKSIDSNREGPLKLIGTMCFEGKRKYLRTWPKLQT